jgi:hypothetical protein
MTVLLAMLAAITAVLAVILYALGDGVDHD